MFASLRNVEEGHSSENDYLEQAQLGRIGVLFVVVQLY